MITLDLGDIATITATFTPGPPTAYVAQLRDPEGVETTISGGAVVGESVVFETDVLTIAGTYAVRVFGTAGAVGGEETEFLVAPSRFVGAVPT